MHQNISLGSNGLDRVRSLRKIPMRLRGTNFCTSSARFPPSFVRQPNSTEYTQMVRNAPKHQFRVKWGGSSMFVVKNSDANSWHELFALIRPVIHRVSYGNQTVLDAPKWYEMHGNVSFDPNGVDWVHSLRKILMQLRGTNFCTSSACFAPSFVRQPNGPKCTQMVRNAWKRQF